MTTDEELFNYLRLTPLQRDALRVLAVGRGADVPTLLSDMLHPILFPLTQNSFYKAAAIQFEDQANLFRNRPITVRYVNGDKMTDTGTKLCVIEGCTNKRIQHGMCPKHFQRSVREYLPILPLSVNSEAELVDAAGVKICENCKKTRSVAKGLCAKCRYQARKSVSTTQV